MVLRGINDLTAMFSQVGYSINSNSLSAFSSGTGGGGQAGGQRSLLSSLKPDLKTSVNLSSGTNAAAIQVSGSNVKSLVNNNHSVLNNVQQQTRHVQAQMSQTIAAAQRQVMGACKDMGHDAASLFPDTRSTPSMGEALLNANGGFMGVLMDAMSELYKGGRAKGGNVKVENAMAEIQARLVTAQSNQVTDMQRAMGQDNAAQDMQQQQFDWKSFFDNGYELKDLMDIDPDDPVHMAHHLPEYREVHSIDENLKRLDIEVSAAEYKNEARPNLDDPHFDPESDLYAVEVQEAIAPESRNLAAEAEKLVSLDISGAFIAAAAKVDPETSTAVSSLHNEPVELMRSLDAKAAFGMSA